MIPIHPAAGNAVSVLFAIVLLLGIAGCGSGKPPFETLSTADTALNQAMAAEASQFAPQDLQRAMDKLARAKEAMADEKYRLARHLASEAQVDAQLAEAKARSASARQTAEQAKQTIRTLRDESGRQGSGLPNGGSSNGTP